MTTTTSSVQPDPVLVHGHPAVLRLAAMLLAAIALSIASFGLGHATAAHRSATAPSVVQLDQAAAVAAVRAFVATPAGQAALAQEFGPGSFGARSASSQPEDQCQTHLPC